MLQVGGSEIFKKNYLSENGNIEYIEECRGNDFLGAKRTTAKKAWASIIYSLYATRKHACDYLTLSNQNNAYFSFFPIIAETGPLFICMYIFIHVVSWQKLNVLIIIIIILKN
jgi:hypothetical protein